MREKRSGIVGPARSFFAQHRAEIIRTSIISLAEVAVAFPTSVDAWAYFKQWTIYRLHDGIAQAASDLDRQLDQRLGENDNWIAGFCLYYRQPIISRDGAFDRVPRLRRLPY
jgi:predicted nucleic acid-binding protein